MKRYIIEVKSKKLNYIGFYHYNYDSGYSNLESLIDDATLYHYLSDACDALDAIEEDELEELSKYNKYKDYEFIICELNIRKKQTKYKRKMKS